MAKAVKFGNTSFPFGGNVRKKKAGKKAAKKTKGRKGGSRGAGGS